MSFIGAHVSSRSARRATLQSPAMANPAPEIFKAYDIRGVVGRTLTEDTVRLIGRALGSEILERAARGLMPQRERQAAAVGRDGRLSGPSLAAALMEGMRSTGVEVIDIGMVPTPISYFAAHRLGCNDVSQEPVRQVV